MDRERVADIGAGVVRLVAASLASVGALHLVGRSLGGEVPPPLALGTVGTLLVLAAILGRRRPPGP